MAIRYNHRMNYFQLLTLHEYSCYLYLHTVLCVVFGAIMFENSFSVSPVINGAYSPGRCGVVFKISHISINTCISENAQFLVMLC